MSRLSEAEAALVSKLDVARTQHLSNVKPPPLKKNVEFDLKKTSNPPNPPHTQADNETRDVLNLEVPRFDKTRSFQGIEKQKIAKKDRHNKALDAFAKTLEIVAENIEQELLATSRAVRETLEVIDKDIKASCLRYQNDDYLVNLSSEELDLSLEDLKSKTSKRLEEVKTFGHSLEDLECKRANIVGEDIKALVNTLISIAHQLPDEIEHIVEAEAFDLNTVLTTNRQAHAQLMAVMHTKQVEMEVYALHEWEEAKKHWRQLRHDQAVSIFHSDIQSQIFTEPSDRQQFMLNVRLGQKERHRVREENLQRIARLNTENISSEEVRTIQSTLAAVNDEELSATQECYNGLSNLRAVLRSRAENRMESLRKELHVYAALHDEPPLPALVSSLRSALSSSQLSELWRQGGGLKSEITAVANDFCSEDMVYERLVSALENRLELIVCGFSLKQVLNERGRLPRLDTVRSLLGKARSVPRLEVASVFTNLLPDLKEMAALEKMPAVFQRSLQECVEGIEKELQRLAEFESGSQVTGRRSNAEASNTLKSRRTATKVSRTTSAVVDAADKAASLDPLLAKQWLKILGMLYYGCDIPENYQAVSSILSNLFELKLILACGGNVCVGSREVSSCH
jgi:hypothetical protein